MRGPSALERLLPALAYVVVPLASALLPVASARAADFQVEAETVGQGYQLRRFGDSGTAMLDRRRLTQYLHLNAFNLLPDDMTGARHDRNTIYFTSAMRFDTDFGGYLTDQPTGTDRIRELPRSASADQFQLLYAVLAGDDLFGFLDFQAGRQIVFDLMDFYSFDGLDLRVKLPWWVAIEGWSGLEVRGESPMASPIYELDGTSPGSRDPATCLASTFVPPAVARGCPDQNAMLAPVYGFALESWGLQNFHGRLAYRRTLSSTAGQQPGDGLPSTGDDEEKVSYTLNAALGHIRPFGGIRYNLLAGRWDQLEAGVRTRLPGDHTIIAQYLFSAPTFDGDSIFNVFATYPFNDARLTYTTPHLGRRKSLQFWLTGFFRLFNDTVSDLQAQGLMPVTPATDTQAAGFDVGGQWRSDRAMVRVDGYHDDGFGGRRTGGDVAGRYVIVVDKLDLEGRLTLINFEPDLQTQNQQHATSFGAQTGLRYVLAEGVSLHGLLEDNHNRYYPYQLRAIALLDLTFWRMRK